MSIGPRALRRLFVSCFVAISCGLSYPAPASMTFIDAQIAAHRGQSGVYVLETGHDALLARAWLADNARRSIDVQYFIWSTDNIGILASEALLRAAERGVRVRVLVDDLLIDAPDESLLALERHPNIDIRIYNAKHSAGTPIYARLFNALVDFRGVNQRMHDKVFIVDDKVAITGGRNMADEYFDYDHEYNFRDRDALVLGAVVNSMRASFGRFWRSEYSSSLEQRYGDSSAELRRRRISDDEAQRIYRELHAYALSAEHFAPELRVAIKSVAQVFPQLARRVVWGDIAFIADRPGKNDGGDGMAGGGLAGEALAQLIRDARRRIVIQSPYVVLTPEAKALLRQARRRGVQVIISTNSMASTDNLPAFAGYRNQRRELLDMGLDVYEYKPDPGIHDRLAPRRVITKGKRPVFALHAKTLVVDSRVVYIGTFNLDPRSQNLNTEVGVVIRDARVARDVERAIETDMSPNNSWRAGHGSSDQNVSYIRRIKVRLWQWMPIEPLL